MLCSAQCKCLSCYNNDGSDRYERSDDSTASPSSVEEIPVTPRDESDDDKRVKESPTIVTNVTMKSTRRSSYSSTSVDIKSTPKKVQTKSPKSSAEKPETRGSSVSVIKGKKKEIVIELSSNLDTNKKHHTKPAPLKKRKVKFATEKQPVYDFFGPNLPSTTKLTALRCLDFLESKDIYAVSQVNHLWCKAAMDDALWE